MRYILNEEEASALSKEFTSIQTKEIEFILRFTKEKEIMEVTIDKRKYTKDEDLEIFLNFFHQRLIFHYIPAIRPTEYSVRIIEEVRYYLYDMNISIKSYDDSSFSVQFFDGFSTPLLNAVRNVPGRRWDSDRKIWLIPDNQKAYRSTDSPSL